MNNCAQKICGQCGNIVVQFIDKTTPAQCLFRGPDNFWHCLSPLFTDCVCPAYHERFIYPVDPVPPPAIIKNSPQLEFQI